MARRKKTYRLQIVLDQKKEARDEAARYLAEKREILKREQEEEARLRRELDENRQRKAQEHDLLAREGLSNALDANRAQQRLNFIKRLDHMADVLNTRIAAQQEKVKHAEQEVEEALQALVQASRELEVMEKHKERWTKKTKQEEDMNEQREMNEIGNIMYNARREAHGRYY